MNTTTVTIPFNGSDIATLSADSIRGILSEVGTPVPSKLKKAELVALATKVREDALQAAGELADAGVPVEAPAEPAPAPEAKPAKKAAAKKAAPKADPNKLSPADKRVIGTQLHLLAGLLVEQVGGGDNLPLKGFKKHLVVEQIEAWMKYIPKES